MKRITANKLFIELTAALFIGLFVYTAIMKLKTIPSFIYAMQQVPLLHPHAAFLSGFIPGLEIGIAVILCIPRTKLVGLVAAGVLMLLFIIYIVFVLATMDKLPCSCGGIMQELSWSVHLLINGLLLLAAARCVKTYKNVIATTRNSRTPA